MTLAPGTIVQLKSGGPRMVVESIYPLLKEDDGTRQAICIWFDFKGRSHRNGFPVELLVLVDPENLNNWQEARAPLYNPSTKRHDQEDGK